MIPEPDITGPMVTAHISETIFLPGLKAAKAKAGLIFSIYFKTIIMITSSKILDRPDIPLHNNLSERDIREYVKRRKISGSTRSENGRLCRDSFTSLKKTCRKLGISFWKYLLDRVENKKEIAPLPDVMIKANS